MIKISTSFVLFEPLLWGFIASIPLLIGSTVASIVSLPKQVIAIIMAFGSGVLVAALAFSLIEEAFNLSESIASVIIGFVLGGLSYTLANYILNKKSSGSTKRRKKSHGEHAGGGKDAPGLALLVGSVMDNIPENMALGISLVSGGGVNIVLIAAIFLSNFPEGLSSAQGMRSNGRSKKYIISLWSVAVVIGTISSVIGFAFLSNTSPSTISIAISFAAGAILVMLAESMIPEAHAEGGSSRTGIATMAGFAIAFILGRLEGG